ncbi:MAG: hypothetical protein JOY61_25795, partial [Chloroflexi bacterium]|nr:hypothetical protein [Chloroflexota bacterium]
MASTTDQAVQRMAQLESLWRELVSLYELQTDTQPNELTSRARLERSNLDRLLHAADEVRDARLSALVAEMRQSTGRTVGEMRPPAPSPSPTGRDALAAAGFQF